MSNLGLQRVSDTTYLDFVRGKSVAAPDAGFEVAPQDLNPRLFDWQRDIVSWALAKGRAAIFADTGLGKSGMALEWARLVHEETGGPVLILTPLAVASQFVSESEKFGIEAPVKHVREPDEVAEGIFVTNYQRLDKFDPSLFAGVVLDESSILRTFGGKTRWQLNRAFADTRFKLCATATPAPNQHSEIGTHAHFLGVMDHGEMLTRWFINDTKEARNLRLKKHGERDFWQWVASWAVCVSLPSDLRDATGRPYPDDGFVLPGLVVAEHQVRTPKRHDAAQEETGVLFQLASPLAATELHKEMRLTAEERALRAAEIVASESSPEEAWIVWCNTNYEADELRKVIPEAIEVRGDMKLEVKEERLSGFARGDFRVLITKPKIAAFGLNYQHCARMVFVGLSYSFEQLYQALRRSYRFGQSREVRAHLITAETETAVLETIHRKQEAHKTMQEKMTAAMRRVGIGADSHFKRADVGAASGRVAVGNNWDLREGDCVEVVKSVEADTVGLSLFSPPFSSLYSYSPSLRDMGNCQSDEEFFEHFSYLIPELLRITVPGRLCIVHTKDLVRYKNQYGYGGLRDFTGDVTRAFERCIQPDGTRWAYHARVTIWKDPVREMQRTKSTGLLYKTLRNDASYSRVGCPEYLSVFRKWTPEADSPEPVTHTREEMPLEVWQRYASPVWEDIRPMDVLNTQAARKDPDEKHICPLQLDLIERCIELWSNPGDLALDPFSGLGSTGYVALEMARRYLGVELKDSYFDASVGNLKAVEDGTAQPDLFEEVVS